MTATEQRLFVVAVKHAINELQLAAALLHSTHERNDETRAGEKEIDGLIKQIATLKDSEFLESLEAV